MKTMNVLKNIFLLLPLLMITQYSCIDRDTIAGTGKELPDAMIGTSGNFQNGTIRAQLPIPLTVRVLAANGRPVRNIVVEFTNPQSRVSFSDTTMKTNGDGYASTIVTLGTVADSIKVYATVIGLKGSPVVFSLLARASSAANAILESGDKQTGRVASPLPSLLKVKVVDGYNNPVKNSTAIFSTPNGSFNPVIANTDSNGIAQSTWTLDTLIGNKTASVNFPSIPQVTINFSATAISLSTPATYTAITKDTVHSLEGVTIRDGLQVQTKDIYGNPISGKIVSYEILSGNPTLGYSSVTTQSNGIAWNSISLAFGDTLAVVRVSPVNFVMPPLTFYYIHYQYLQIDSISSSGGTVRLVWEINPNKQFQSYVIERCDNFLFDQTAVILATITDVATTAFVDSTAPVGSSPYYRVRVYCSSNFNFYTNIRQTTVVP